MKAQKASKEQQLNMMNKHYKELESRLDEMLSRIAREAEEIKDLEQQLTDGKADLVSGECCFLNNSPNSLLVFTEQSS